MDFSTSAKMELCIYHVTIQFIASWSYFSNDESCNWEQFDSIDCSFETKFVQNIFRIELTIG